MIRIAFSLLAAAIALPLSAQTPATPASAKSYAQELVDKTVAKHPELLVLDLHVTPPKSSENVIVASKEAGRIGKPADPDDLNVIKTGTSLAEVNKTGDRFEVQLPLQDANRRTVGSVEMAFPYKTGDDKSALKKKAEKIRDELRRRISHVANLVEPAQFDPQIPTDTYAQYLLDDTLAKHPEVVILAMHAKPPKGGSDYPIVASNIGRIGKKADEDDMHVITSGEPKLEVNETGDRFESELVLQDVSRKNIGAIGVVFPYKKGDDQAALNKKAEKIRDELRRRITNAGNLYEPYPSTK
jgi:RNase H-fold protein (predicted Holliday junction resolvase)